MEFAVLVCFEGTENKNNILSTEVKKQNFICEISVLMNVPDVKSKFFAMLFWI